MKRTGTEDRIVGPHQHFKQIDAYGFMGVSWASCDRMYTVRVRYSGKERTRSHLGPGLGRSVQPSIKLNIVHSKKQCH